MIGGFQNIAGIPELRKRIFFTLMMLAVFRIGIQIPTPGINTVALAAFFAAKRGTLFGLFDMFSGGALEKFSIFALGIMPYISASIILQLLTVVIPHLERLSKEGEAGRKKITQYTRYGTVVLSIIQGLGISVGLENMAGPGGEAVVMFAGWGFRLMTVLTLTSGTAFIMWMGEKITERGIGNGISLIIFAGIVARMPSAIINTVNLMKTGALAGGIIGLIIMLFLVAFMLLVIGCIVFMERGQRRIPVQYAKRVVGRKMYGGQSTHLPLKINTAGVIPPIFASSILMFPATIGNFTNISWVQQATQFMTTPVVYDTLFVILIIFFSYFYTAVSFNPVDVAENMKKYGGYIPGIRPGKRTSDFIDRVLTRITLVGALYVSAVCVLPSILTSQLNVPFYFGGTALLIVVGVAMDTIAQIETHMVARHYEGFMKSARIKGRR